MPNRVSNEPQLLDQVIDMERYPLAVEEFTETCRETLDRDGCLVLPGFLTSAAIESVRAEGDHKQSLAWYCEQKHNVYLTPPDPDFAMDHPRNREVASSKGCITDDQIGADSPLRTIYDSDGFRQFLCSVLGEQALHEYADPLSSINVHYASQGEELGWHFDNSSFAITLMIRRPEKGGKFEFIRGIRDSEAGEMRFDAVQQVLDGELSPDSLSMDAGALVLFRGRNAIHRVTPVEGSVTRMLVVLAYNSEPGIALSESARMTFYGRLQ